MPAEDGHGMFDERLGHSGKVQLRWVYKGIAGQAVFVVVVVVVVG